MKKTRKLLALLLVMCIIVITVSACNKDNGSAPSDSSQAPNAGTNPSDSPNQSSSSSSNSNSNSNSNSSQSPAPGDNTEANTPVVSDRPLNIAVGQDNGSLHPFGVSGTGGFASVLGSCYEGLFFFNDAGEKEWLLATGIDVISDLQSTIHIRQGVTFSNGNPLTAEDVMFSIEENAKDARSFLNVKGIDVEKTSVTDDYTIDLWFTEFNAAQEPGFASMSIMDKESYDEVALVTHPIGTGPYVITEYVVGSHVTAVARDDYWGDPPLIRTLNYKIINEPSQIVNALETGAVDTAAIPLKDAAYIESLGYRIDTIFGNSVDVPYFNMTEGSLLGTKEARWAVCHAIDRQTIADLVYDGKSSPPRWPLSEFLLDFEPRFANRHEVYSIGYDLDRARELAEQAGLIGQTLRVITNGTTDGILIAEIIQSDLMKIGVNSEIINYDMATYFSVVMDESNYDFAIYYVAAPSMMAVDMFAMYLTFVPLGWHGPDRDLWGELTMKALTTPDEAARSEMLNDYLDMFLDYTPWFAISEQVSMRACSKDVEGMQYTLSGGFRLKGLHFVN